MNPTKFLLSFFAAVFLFTSSAAAQTFNADFVRNNDGDTFHAKVEIPSMKRFFDYKKVKVRCRLFQSDTYELDSEGMDGDRADEARILTERLLSTKKFYLEYYGKDFHGRWLVTVVFDDYTTLTERLRERGLLTGKYENAKENRRIEKHPPIPNRKRA